MADKWFYLYPIRVGTNNVFTGIYVGDPAIQSISIV